MAVTRDMLTRSLTVLQGLCPDADFSLDWAMGQPRRVRRKQSVDVSRRATKSEVDQYIRMVIAGVEIARRQ